MRHMKIMLSLFGAFGIFSLRFVFRTTRSTPKPRFSRFRVIPRPRYCLFKLIVRVQILLEQRKVCLLTNQIVREIETRLEFLVFVYECLWCEEPQNVIDVKRSKDDEQREHHPHTDKQKVARRRRVKSVQELGTRKQGRERTGRYWSIENTNEFNRHRRRHNNNKNRQDIIYRYTTVTSMFGGWDVCWAGKNTFPRKGTIDSQRKRIHYRLPTISRTTVLSTMVQLFSNLKNYNSCYW